MDVFRSGVIVEKASEELFAIDTTGDKDIAKAYRLKHKPLKADEILAARSAVPPVDSRKRSSRLTDGVLEPSGKKRRGGGVPFRELQRLKHIAYGGESVPKDVVEIPETKSYDPWVDGSSGVIAMQDPRFSFLEPPKPVKEPRTLKQAPISLAANGKEIPAVRKPEPGISYNPTFKDWDELLIKEGGKEMEAEKKRLRDAEEERQALERAAATAAEEDDMVISDQEGHIEDPETEILENAWLARKRPERKTQAQRNKIKRRKEAERKALWESQMKKKALQAAEIKKIKKTIEAKERSRIEAAAEKKEITGDGDDRVLRRRRFGKIP
jgi:nucleolar protein 53